MKYIVVEEYHDAEFDFDLYPDDFLYDGDIEPDLMAELYYRGILYPEYKRGVKFVPPVKEEPELEEVEFTEEDE